MSLRTKLFLYFLSISLLIIIVGMIFYFQLKNLVEPLTPQSIPRSVEQLANTIDRNETVNKLMYQQLLVEKNLEYYIATGQRLPLQEYYMNNSIVFQLLSKVSDIDPKQYDALQKKWDVISLFRDDLIKQMEGGQAQLVKQQVSNDHYQAAVYDFKKALTSYFKGPETNTNESAVITVKLAAKNSHAILEESLNITLIVFFDAVLASLILVFVSTRSIVRPINTLRNNIEKIGVDQFALSISSELLTLKGEVGDLARSFSELFIKLSAATVLRDELLKEIQRQKETERQLEETAARLNESNLDLDQFAYAASHDLRSPLRAIESLIRWIEEDCYQLLPEDSRKNFDMIKRRLHRLDALIAGMLEYSRAGNITHEHEHIDLNKLVSEIIDNLAPPAHIKVSIDTELPILKADKAKITQVFLNLISNAIKYNDKLQGFINIGFVLMDNSNQFYVKDNGCGIETEFHEKVFDIFQTLQSRDTIESSGIGLAIVKKIIDKSGGKIWLSSKLHEGTTFYFTWPVG